jgi:phosphotransacetylase
MTVKKLDELFDLIKGKKIKYLIAVCANDKSTLIAVHQAVEKKIIKGILIGDKVKINSICQEEGIDSEQFTIFHQPIEERALQLAISMINKGEGDLLMKGMVATDKFMRAILNKENGLTEMGKLVSHITVLENINYPKLLIVSDVAIIPLPDLNQKIQMITYMVEIASSLSIVSPKIAILAPSEKVIPAIQSSTEGALLSKMGERGQISGCIIDGPLSLDIAIDPDAALIKGVRSPIAGDADCLLFPNLESGNIFYKVNTKLAHAEMAAIVMGTRIPVILPSRGDTTRVKLFSLALGALMIAEKE